MSPALQQSCLAEAMPGGNSQQTITRSLQSSSMAVAELGYLPEQRAIEESLAPKRARTAVQAKEVTRQLIEADVRTASEEDAKQAAQKKKESTRIYRRELPAAKRQTSTEASTSTDSPPSPPASVSALAASEQPGVRPRPGPPTCESNFCGGSGTIGPKQSQPCCPLRGRPSVAACDALNERVCTRCSETHAPVDVAAALDAARVGAGLTARHSLDCRQLQGDDVLPRPRGGPALRRVVPPERLAAFERINGTLSPPDDPSPPPPLQAAPMVGSSKLLVLAKVSGYQWWPGLVAVYHRHAAGPVRVDFLQTCDYAQVAQANLRPFTDADAAEELPAKATPRAAMEEARQLFGKTMRRRAERASGPELCRPVLLKCAQCSRTWNLDYVWELCVRVDVATVLNLDGSDVRARPPPVGTTKPVILVCFSCVHPFSCVHSGISVPWTLLLGLRSWRLSRRNSTQSWPQHSLVIRSCSPGRRASTVSALIASIQPRRRRWPSSRRWRERS